MQNQALTGIGLVVLSSLALSCAASDSGPEGPGGNTVDNGTGGRASAGSGGVAPVGNGGADPTENGGAEPTGTGGTDPMGTGGAGPTGNGGAEPTGTGGADPAGNGGGGGESMGGSGGVPGDHWGGLKNPPVKSAGCGKAASLTTGEKTIMSSGRQREYMIDVPEDYDPEKPYRLFYASHGLGGEDEHVATWWNYFGLKTQAEAANEPAVFIAPQAIERWDETDHALFDDITDLAKDSLCIDTSRVFVTGMSFGGLITYSLSTNHQKRFRAGVALAPANYNIWLPDTKAQDPIAWMQTTGMSDNTCPWVNNEAAMTGSKFIALEKAADNGCTIPDEIETWDQNHPTRHICIDLEGCKTGYPVKVCTFNGAHWQFPYDEGNGEDLDRSWVPVEAWKFFMQF